MSTTILRYQNVNYIYLQHGYVHLHHVLTIITHFVKILGPISPFTYVKSPKSDVQVIPLLHMTVRHTDVVKW